MATRSDPFAGREFANHRKKIEQQPEYFSLVEYTASLDPLTLRRRIDAESSLYRWCEVVLGYADLPADCDYRLYEPAHRPMCDRAEQALPIRERRNRGYQKKVLDLEPRGSLKTNLFTTGSLLYYLVFDYDGRELISSHNHKAAKEILGLMKWYMEFGKTFRLFYGDWSYYAKKYGTWREDQIELAFRSKGYREPTVDTCGAEISKTGGHYDVIAVDDIQNRENVRSEVERQNVRERFQEYLPQLDPSGGMLVPGTRYHKQDVYGWIMRRAEEAKKKGADPEWVFDVTVRSAWNPDGSLYYPTRLSEKYLAQQEFELEDYLFAVWFRNEPIDDSTKVFVNPKARERDFDFVNDLVPYIQPPNGQPRTVYVTMSWDPKGRETTSVRRRTDFHGLIINGCDTADIWWILMALELKLPLDQLLDRIARLIRQHQVRKLSIETRGASMQGLYIDLLKPVLVTHGLIDLVEIVEWSPGTQESKQTLIRSLQPRFRRGGMWFRKGYCDPLIQQLDDFPQLANDDVADALVQQKGLARPPEVDDFPEEGDSEGDFDAPEESEDQQLTRGSIGLGTPGQVA
jgi:phage terminase large subunit-like protein